jgi:protein tyrosine/serine phosphatase
MDARAVLLSLAIPALALSAGACGKNPAVAPDSRPATWAEPVTKPGLPNLHKVSDALYRGAQPAPEGFKTLQAMGVKTVVNLRSSHTDDDEIGTLALKKVRIRCKAWDPEGDEVDVFLKVVADPANHPVFVHCQHGADRTGLMCAIYRMAIQGWTREQAVEEMTKGGFGYHSVWDDLLEYLQKVDVEALKKKAGIASPSK